LKLKLGQIADWIHAEGDFDGEAVAQGYSIDSRTLGQDELFFAVRGERVDGHEYVETAFANGALAAVVSMRWLAPATMDGSKLLRVPDADCDCILSSMQKLARQVRRTWGKRVIGVTGSAGKTTTKECVAAVLSARFHVLKTEGNLNNHFGVPLQLLRLEPEHDVAVLEMGMNHAGEIAALARIAEPDWAVVSNVAPVHLEHFADGIEGIARAKRELVDALPADGLAFLNADDDRVAQFGNGREGHAVFYGTHEAAQVRAVEVEELGLAGTQFLVKIDGQQHSLHLQLPGRHNVLNALAAVAVGVALRLPLPACCEALEALRPTERRGSVIEWNGARLINDCYNSNPHALNSMVAMLAGTEAQRRILVAGEMLELGVQAPMLHEECGRAAAQAGLDVVIGVRGLARELAEAAAETGTEALFVDTPEQAGAWLRGVRLERALALLEPQPAPQV
jgi:UDP-N-acetylmuramoyl-tripeptide--D-alanyl-D-alanine ligase